MNMGNALSIGPNKDQFPGALANPSMRAAIDAALGQGSSAPAAPVSSNGTTDADLEDQIRRGIRSKLVLGDKGFLGYSTDTVG